MEFLDLFIFTTLIALILLLGIRSAFQVKTENYYLFAGRKTKLFPLIATLVMTEFNTGTLVAFSSAGYYARWWALSLPFVFLFGLMFYSLVVARKWKSFNGVSVAHYFAERYGRRMGVFTGVILFAAMAGFSATYVKALTLIFNPIFLGVNPWLVSSGLVALILCITWRGGLSAIIRTDILSFLIVIIFFPVLLFYCHHIHAFSDNMKHFSLSQMQQALPFKFVISLIVLTMFSYILAPWYGQKVISAQTPAIASLAVAIAAIFIFILYGLGIAITTILANKGLQLGDPQQALPYAIRYVLPSGWQGLGYAVLFLTAATTLTGMWGAMVTLLINFRPLTNAKNKLYWSIFVTGLCALLSYLLANLFVDQVFNKMILVNIPVVALSFALLAGFYWKKTNTLGISLSIVVGLLWGIGCYLHYGTEHLYTWYWAIYGIPLIFVTGILGTLAHAFFKVNIHWLRDLS